MTRPQLFALLAITALLFVWALLVSSGSRVAREAAPNSAARFADPLDEARALVRQLHVAREVLSPAPGASAAELRFRAANGAEVRISRGMLPGCTEARFAGLLDGAAVLALTLQREGRLEHHTFVVKPGSMAVECAAAR